MNGTQVASEVGAKAGAFALASSIAAFPVLGIPILAIAAGLIGGSFSHIQRETGETESGAKALAGILADAVTGGWIAIALVHFVPLQAYGVDNVPVEVLSGLLAWGMSAIRAKAGGYADKAFQALLTAGLGIFERFGGGRNG